MYEIDPHLLNKLVKRRLIPIALLLLYLTSSATLDGGVAVAQRVDDLRTGNGSRDRRRTRKRPVETVVRLLITSTPNSSVFIDDKLKGETDGSGQLAVDMASRPRYKIRITHEGFVTKEEEVEITGYAKEQIIDFPLIRALVQLRVTSIPPEAEIYLNDVRKGITSPTGLLVIDQVAAGQQHVLRARKEGFVQESIPVTSLNPQITLKPVSAAFLKLRVVTDPPETEIYLDDIYKGTTNAEGVLVIDQVSANEPHTLRGRKIGFLKSEPISLQNVSSSSIKLRPDPVVVLLTQMKELVATGQLPKALETYDQLIELAPQHPELPMLLETTIRTVQLRSMEVLKTVGPLGLSIPANDLKDLNKLYHQARKWKTVDETLEPVAIYWAAKFSVADIEKANSPAELEIRKRAARLALNEFSAHDLRNPYLLLDIGWLWWQLGDRVAAQKQFMNLQELRPDWAYPRFAYGVLAMSTAESEMVKTAKALKYGEAIDSFTKAISLKHDFARAYALRSISYSGLAKKYEEEAIASGLQAVALDPQDAYAHFALGLAYFQKGKSRYRAARDEFNRALALESGELDPAARSSIHQRLAQINKNVK